jgi:hypothetical protein
LIRPRPCLTGCSKPRESSSHILRYQPLLAPQNAPQGVATQTMTASRWASCVQAVSNHERKRNENCRLFSALTYSSTAVGVMAIFYDPVFSCHTPLRLFLSTGIRALDHAVETIYHPNSSEVPWKALASRSIQTLFEHLPTVARASGSTDQGSSGHDSPPLGATNPDVLVHLHLAAWAAAGLRGSNFGGGMGLSHSLGHALGSPYGIPRKSTWPRSHLLGPPLATCNLKLTIILQTVTRVA